MATTEPTEDLDADEIWQTHIYAPEEDFRSYASVTADSPELETSATKRGQNRELLLSKGGDLVNGEPTPSQDWPFVQQSAPEHNMNRTLVWCDGVAVGYYLHHLETHNIEEETAYSQLCQLQEEVGLPMEEYIVFLNDLDKRKRKLRLLDLLEFRVRKGGDWAAKPYLDSCSWRSTGLNEAQQAFAEQLLRELDPNPQHCYRNAQRAAIKHQDNHRVEYVEGVALPKNGAQVSRHAWIEYEGQVIELTWPWHYYDGSDAVYFGRTFDKDEVAETFERRNGGSQMVLSDEQIQKLKNIRAEE